jgi:general secretion pathway protein H
MQMHTHIAEHGRTRGVTLLELLVVAALASILLALVFPSIRAGMGTMELRSSAQQLAAAAKFARDQAIFRQRPFELDINTATGEISVMDNQGFLRKFTLPANVRVGGVMPPVPAGSDDTRRFLFSPDGSTEPFRVVLENSRRRVEVSTDALTGFPKVAEL